MTFHMKGFPSHKGIEDNIRYMPGDSHWDSRVPRDVDIIKQHIYNTPRNNNKYKKKRTNYNKNRNRSV